MNLEDLIDEHLAGHKPEVPAELAGEFQQALAGHAALQYVLGETISVHETAPADRAPPALPEDYEVVRELGHGGMGVVYLVRQKSLGRLVAIKVLRPGEAAFGRLVKRFLEEARHLARLRHPNIVSVHETGQAAGEPYFTMDYVEGESLAAVLARERISPTRSLAILLQTAEAIHHAHTHGIIHRDLKPGNILLDKDDRAYVTDFGLARDMTQTSKLTRSGEVMGTPAYMAPEQAQGRADLIGEATDVHALGAILYETLTGQPPYGCDAPANVLVRLLKEDPVPPRRLDRRIPRGLEAICLKALAKAPEHRYATVRAFQEDLRRFQAGQPVHARRPGPVYHALRFLRRYWKAAAALMLLGTALGVLGPYFDRTAEQLLTVADEQRDAGDYSAAIRIYRKALGKSSGAMRRAILEKMLACCAAISDDKSAVDACLLVVQSDPDVSFGKYDWLVAQALVAQARVLDPNGSIRFPSDRSRPLLELAQKRFQIFLAGGGGNPTEREEAETILAAMDQSLAGKPMSGSPYVDKTKQLPEGTPGELLAKASDQKVSRWERGKAAYAAGRALEGANQNPAALTSYRDAYELMRSVYPYYAGVAAGISASVTDRSIRNRAPVCELLQEVFQAVQRLDPAVPDALRGGLRIKLEGVAIPAGLSLWLNVVLTDAALSKEEVRRGNLEPWLHRWAPVQLDQTIWVGVADGRYHLSLGHGGMSWDAKAPGEPHRVGRLLELDGDSLPDVEINGSTREVVVPIRLSEEIRLLSPGPGETFDLSKDLFRWSPIKGASRYKVLFGRLAEMAQGTGTSFQMLADVNAPAASLCLGTLPATEVRNLVEYLTPGRTATWKVEAFDPAGRRVGLTLAGNGQPFLVARGLEAKSVK
jgi:predicted Ser/Thr protein kinase